VVPHLLRPWIGQRPAALLVPSLLTGAILFTVADMLVRIAPLVMPVSAAPPLGVLTALLGAPFLIRIVRRMTP
jgi:iron complex transport system permease protein